MLMKLKNSYNFRTALLELKRICRRKKFYNSIDLPVDSDDEIDLDAITVTGVQIH